MALALLVVGATNQASAKPATRTRALPGVTATLTGTVVSSSATRFVLRDDNGTDRAFSVDNPSILPAGVVPYTRLSVTFKELESGALQLVEVDTWGAMEVTPVEHQPRDSQSSSPDVGLRGAMPMVFVVATLVLGAAVALAAMALRWTRRAF